MSIGGMIGHVIEDRFHAPGMSTVNKRVQVPYGPEKLVDTCVVGYVISEISHRRWIDRRNPDRIYSKPFQIIEPAYHARDIPYPIPITVLE